MAGIEKICEYSGEYPGWLMYGYKHNLIQVMPKYRSLFKGQQATLFVWPQSQRFIYSGGAYTDADYVLRDIENGRPRPRGKFAQEYGYALHVPGVPGDVNGVYINQTLDLKAAKHKLRKLLGLKSTRHLRIIKIRDYQDLRERVEL